ncbi:hypothetical protein ERJ75_000646500 [Trypanosoma vivax]|nr:hypothetical protein ERJ75_000646500 [Trypanosoma vivax]
MQRLFCTCAFLLAAASVAALGADPGPGSNAAEFAVLCGALQGSAGSKGFGGANARRNRTLCSSWTRRTCARRDRTPGTGAGIGPRTEVGEAGTRSPRALATSLAEMAEATRCRQFTAASRRELTAAGDGRRKRDNKLLTMLRGEDTNGGFDADGNDAGLILPMILLCNDARTSSACGTGDGTTCPCSTAAVPASGLEQTNAKGWEWKVLKAHGRYQHGRQPDLIVGNWLITKHICETKRRTCGH